MATREELLKFADEADRAGKYDDAEEALRAVDAMDAAQRSARGTVADPLAQGFFWGGADELSGLVGAIPAAIQLGDLTPSGVASAYRGIRDAARENNRQFTERNPKTALAANVVGGVGSAAAGAVLAPAAGAMAVQAPIRAWGLAGGVGGYLGSDAETAGGLARDTAIGTAVGGALGRLSAPTANAIGQVVTAPARLAEARSASRPARVIANRLARDETTTQQAAARLAKMPAGATIADAAGDNTARLAEDIIAMPGKAATIGRDVFAKRQAKAASRVDSAINAALQIKGDFYTAMQAIQNNLKTRAKPFYDAAYAESVLQTPTLKGLMKRLNDAAPDVLESARKKARLDGQVTGTSVRYYDYVKRALDDKIGAATRSGENDNARVWQGIKKSLLDELDARIPAYKTARSIFSDDAGMKEALEMGRSFLREDSEVIAQQMSTMSEAEKQMFRMGAARELRDKILSRPDTADVYKAFFNKPLMREKIRAIFPDRKSFARLQRAMLNEQKMYATSSGATGNSATARRLMGVRDLATDPETAMDAATGGPKFAVLNAARKYVRQRLGPLANENLREQVARMLFEGDPQTRKQILMALEKPPQVRPYVPGTINRALTTPGLAGAAGANVPGLLSN
jgi:hypothetical protein